MDSNRLRDVFPAKGEGEQEKSVQAVAPTIQVTQPANVLRVIDSSKKVDRADMVNTLNRLHFLGETVLLQFCHRRYHENHYVQAHPQPCAGDELCCLWGNEKGPNGAFDDYQFLRLVIDDRKTMVLIPAVLQSLNLNSVVFQLPEEGFVVSRRGARRYDCREIFVEVIQNDFFREGRLLDFNPLGFRVSLSRETSDSAQSFNEHVPAIILLRQEAQLLFSGSCRCIRKQRNGRDIELVLVPEKNVIKRFKGRQVRNPRLRLSPSPSIEFEHPLIAKRIELDVQNISTSGFSALENLDESTLLPGLIIPEMFINFVGALRLPCCAQVIYRMEEEENKVRCGLAFTDMDLNAYSSLTRVLSKTMDPYSSLSNNTDLDSLWEFLFDTGFIYSSKYRLLHMDRDRFRETFRRLYQENPSIARHFTYQENGKIYGHISMVRAYDRAWLVHHHAARAMHGNRVGFAVLKQMMHFLNDVHRLPSAKIDYAFCFFRPDKKIPDRAFADFARKLDNPQGCSLDLFSYLPYTSLSLDFKLPKGWEMRLSTDGDLEDLRHYYVHVSGGLLLEALCLQSGGNGEGNKYLEEEYKAMGFSREIRTYSIKYKENLVAVCIVDRSERGINLSELLNSIKVMVIDTDGLPWDVLCLAISRLTGEYKMKEVPVLIYPFSYIEKNNIPFERQYNFWVLNMNFLNQYIEYTKKKFRMSY